ncbi:hypothetical protein D9M72_444100 [compost metagenome]
MLNVMRENIAVIAQKVDNVWKVDHRTHKPQHLHCLSRLKAINIVDGDYEPPIELAQRRNQGLLEFRELRRNALCAPQR